MPHHFHQDPDPYCSHPECCATESRGAHLDCPAGISKIMMAESADRIRLKDMREALRSYDYDSDYKSETGDELAAAVRHFLANYRETT